MGYITEKELKKRCALSGIGLFVPMLIFVPIMVYCINGASDFWSAFWQMTAKNPNATYICINDSEAFCPEDIERQALCIDDDIDSVFHRLM